MHNPRHNFRWSRAWHARRDMNMTLVTSSDRLGQPHDARAVRGRDGWRLWVRALAGRPDEVESAALWCKLDIGTHPNWHYLGEFPQWNDALAKLHVWLQSL